MSMILKIVLFILSNIAGSFAGPFVLVVAGMMGLIGTIDTFPVNSFLPRVMLTWIVCMLFSLSWFFVNGIWRYFFLLAPVLIPLFYAILLILVR